MLEYEKIAELPREKLVELLDIYAKNWLATDGLWFQAVEGRRGFAEALELDKEMWRRFTVIEAKRIRAFLQLPEQPGLDGLRRALQFRLYAPLNKAELYYEDGSLIYKVVTCRVQSARERKGMAYHTCKPVGLVEYSLFAATIDSRIDTECVSCHPEVVDPGCNCLWRFSLKAQ